MIFAQINNNIIQNTILLDDLSLESLFSAGFQAFNQIDNLTPQPGIGWAWSGGTSYSPPSTPAPVPLNKQYTPQQYGQLLINQLSASNTQRGLTTAQVFSMAQSFSTFFILLQTGSLETVLSNLPNIPIDGVIVTTSLVSFFGSSINAYLNGD